MCPGGKVQPNSGADGCEECEANFYSSAGATQCGICPYGKYSDEGWTTCLFLPTGQPTSQPSAHPTTQPTSHPTAQPTCTPTSLPSVIPTASPTSLPTRQPTTQPTTHPTSQPTMQPTGQPTGKPTNQPTRQPTAQPTSSPTLIPTSLPTCIPTQTPSEFIPPKSLSNANIISNSKNGQVIMGIVYGIISLCCILFTCFFVRVYQKRKEHEKTPYEKWLEHYSTKQESENNVEMTSSDHYTKNPLQKDNTAALMYSTQHFRGNPLSRGKLHEAPSVIKRQSFSVSPSGTRTSVSPSGTRTSVSPSGQRQNISSTLRHPSGNNPYAHTIRKSRSQSMSSQLGSYDDFYNIYDDPYEKNAHINPLHE
jgi:hypothetical protein